jgi:hypothetical protein
MRGRVGVDTGPASLSSPLGAEVNAYEYTYSGRGI